MIGDYATFAGRHNADNCDTPPVKEAFAVEYLGADDVRMGKPRGVLREMSEPDHPILQGIE